LLIMSKIGKLIGAITSRNDPDMVNILKEMTIEEVNATHIFSSCRHNRTVIGALHAACIVNNTTAVVTLLRIDGIKLNQTIGGVSCYNCLLGNVRFGLNYSGSTPILIAAHKKHKDIFELLVQDDRVNLKVVSPSFGGGLPKILKDSSEENHVMLVKMLDAMIRQEKPKFSYSEQQKTPELDILKGVLNNFGELLESCEMSDFKIICEGEEFPCHKNILMARSNVLRTMFNNDMQETNQNQMTIIDMEPAVVKCFLNFIYTGEVSSEDLKENAMKLLGVADQYELKGLTKLCENELMTTVDNDNVLAMIMKADQFNADILMKVCMKWIVANQKYIVKQEGWKEVLVRFPNLMIDMIDSFTN